MRLLLIHGRSQEGRSSSELKSVWTGALEAGAKAAGLRLPTVDVVVPFFGDLLARLVQDHILRSTEELDRFVTEAESEIYLRAGVELPNPISPPVSFDGPPMVPGDFDPRGGEAGNAILKLDPVQRGIAAFDAKSPAFSRWVIQQTLTDVYVYLTSDTVRRTVEACVYDELRTREQEPTIVIGHSLGSVVAYNFINQHAEMPWEALLTVGSPLGIHAVSTILPTYTPPFPRTRSIWGETYKTGWFNAYDPADIVALNPLVPPQWPLDPPIANYSKVRNATPNAHGISGYLADPVVSRLVCNLAKSID